VCGQRARIQASPLQEATSDNQNKTCPTPPGITRSNFVTPV
jgi:hypothetical protein